jgi:asparagine synthase (glutamine-hydrolysing)
LRVMKYLLALPPFPWFYQKMLVREAMVGKLPEAVRTRPKTPMSSEPLGQHIRNRTLGLGANLHWNPAMPQFINCSALTQLALDEDSEKTAAALRPICLNFWLQSMRRVGYNFPAEAWDG